MSARRAPVVLAAAGLAASVLAMVLGLPGWFRLAANAPVAAAWVLIVRDAYRRTER